MHVSVITQKSDAYTDEKACSACILYLIWCVVTTDDSIGWWVSALVQGMDVWFHSLVGGWISTWSGTAFIVFPGSSRLFHDGFPSGAPHEVRIFGEHQATPVLQTVIHHVGEKP